MSISTEASGHVRGTEGSNSRSSRDDARRHSNSGSDRSHNRSGSPGRSSHQHSEHPSTSSYRDNRRSDRDYHRERHDDHVVRGRRRDEAAENSRRDRAPDRRREDSPGHSERFREPLLSAPPLGVPPLGWGTVPVMFSNGQMGQHQFLMPQPALMHQTRPPGAQGRLLSHPPALPVITMPTVFAQYGGPVPVGQWAYPSMQPHSGEPVPDNRNLSGDRDGSSGSSHGRRSLLPTPGGRDERPHSPHGTHSSGSRSRPSTRDSSPHSTRRSPLRRDRDYTDSGRSATGSRYSSDEGGSRRSYHDRGRPLLRTPPLHSASRASPDHGRGRPERRRTGRNSSPTDSVVSAASRGTALTIGNTVFSNGSILGYRPTRFAATRPPAPHGEDAASLLGSRSDENLRSVSQSTAYETARDRQSSTRGSSPVSEFQSDRFDSHSSPRPYRSPDYRRSYNYHRKGHEASRSVDDRQRHRDSRMHSRAKSPSRRTPPTGSRSDLSPRSQARKADKARRNGWNDGHEESPPGRRSRSTERRRPKRASDQERTEPARDAHVVVTGSGSADEHMVSPPRRCSISAGGTGPLPVGSPVSLPPSPEAAPVESAALSARRVSSTVQSLDTPPRSRQTSPVPNNHETEQQSIDPATPARELSSDMASESTRVDHSETDAELPPALAPQEVSHSGTPEGRSSPTAVAGASLNHSPLSSTTESSAVHVPTTPASSSSSAAVSSHRVTSCEPLQASGTAKQSSSVIRNNTATSSKKVFSGTSVRVLPGESATPRGRTSMEMSDTTENLDDSAPTAQRKQVPKSNCASKKAEKIMANNHADAENVRHQRNGVEYSRNVGPAQGSRLRQGAQHGVVSAVNKVKQTRGEEVEAPSSASAAAAEVPTAAAVVEACHMAATLFREVNRLPDILRKKDTPAAPSRKSLGIIEGVAESADNAASNKRLRSQADLNVSISSSQGEASSSAGELNVMGRKLTPPEVSELETLIKKRKRKEILVPSYKKQEPRWMQGIFHEKILADLEKLRENVQKAPDRKRAALPEGGRVHLGDVVGILKNGASVSDDSLRKIFLYALEHQRLNESYLAFVCVLLANGIDCSIPDEAGDLPLKTAIKSKDLSLVDMLLRHSRHTKLDRDDNSALHLAAMAWLKDKSCWILVQMVLEHTSTELLLAEDFVGKQPLTIFLSDTDFSANHLDEILNLYGPAEVETRCGHLLHTLAMHRRIDLIRMCITRHGFDPSQTDDDGRTILHLLASCATLDKHDAEVIAELIQGSLGIPLNTKDKKGRTEMEIAQSSGNRTLVTHMQLAGKKTFKMDKDVLIRDISNGKESFTIRVMNDKNTALMNNFVYVRQNIYLGDNPTTTGSMYCTCAPGNCLPMECTCLQRGLAYSATGTIVPGSCKGNPIFECGARCGCGSSCQSRVVQRGIRMPFEIMMTRNRGWGVRCVRTIQPGEFMMEFVGEIVESDVLLARDPQNDWAMELTVDNYDGVMYHVDPTQCGNIARFLNHSCDPNLFPARVYVSGDSPDVGVRMAMFSAQVVQKGKELTFDYGDEYWHRQNERGIFCACGSGKCRFASKKKGKR